MTALWLSLSCGFFPSKQYKRQASCLQFISSYDYLAP